MEKGKGKGKEIERAIGDSKTSILGRGSRKAKLEGDSKRRKQMLKDDSAQADEIEDEAEPHVLFTVTDCISYKINASPELVEIVVKMILHSGVYLGSEPNVTRVPWQPVPFQSDKL